MRIKTSSLKPGIALGTDVFSFDGQLLLPKGEKVTAELLDALIRREIHEVIITDDSPRQSSARSFDDAYSHALALTKSFMYEVKLGQPLAEKDISDILNLLGSQVDDQNDIFRQMRLMKGRDEYLLTHSLNVSLLSMLIGRWMGLSPQDISALGQAGLLHDIGKAMIPDQILNKPAKLTDDECIKIKEHSVIGFELVKDYPWLLHGVADAILGHHERQDGQGYPFGLGEGSIGLYSEILAIADTYDALTSNRVYCPRVSPFSAVDVVWKESFGRLNPRIAKIFYDRMTNFYVGNEVLLSNQDKGVVIYIDPSEPTRPIIRVGDRFCNLIEDRSLYIVEVFDE